MREERLVCAYEILDLFSELLLQRLPVMEKARRVPTHPQRTRAAHPRAPLLTPAPRAASHAQGAACGADGGCCHAGVLLGALRARAA